MESKGWYAVDLDGTLAHYDQFRGATHIGEPVPKMVEHVNKMLDEGKDVRIFTARVSPITLVEQTRSQEEAEQVLQAVITAIYTWMVAHLKRPIPITCCKDYQMILLYDDRCVQINPNTGERADGQPL